MIVSHASPSPPIDALRNTGRRLSSLRNGSPHSSDAHNLASLTSDFCGGNVESTREANPALRGQQTANGSAANIVRPVFERADPSLEDASHSFGVSDEINGSIVELQRMQNGFAEELTDGVEGDTERKEDESCSGHGQQRLGIFLKHSEDGSSDGGVKTSLVNILSGSELAAALKGYSGDSILRENSQSEQILKLSAGKIQQLISSPESIPHRTVSSKYVRNSACAEPQVEADASTRGNGNAPEPIIATKVQQNDDRNFDHSPEMTSPISSREHIPTSRNRPHGSRAVSTPNSWRKQVPLSNNERLTQTWNSRSRPDRLTSGRPAIDTKGRLEPAPQIPEPLPPPRPQVIPLPPISIPTYLHLELASGRPSPSYIHRSASSEFPYESSRVKVERLMNFLMLPFALEQVLWFGALACLDNWLYSFTILPLRFIKALYILLESWCINLSSEIQFIAGFIFNGVGRVWRRSVNLSRVPHSKKRAAEDATDCRRVPSSTADGKALIAVDEDFNKSKWTDAEKRRTRRASHKHHRQRSVPSALLPDDKADILKGLLMIATCCILMFFDASRMYHWIRGQAAIKLYVIYNVLEVGDRLFAAIGQDVLECLFSREALERKPDGRSKILRPFWLFLLALIYTVIHATALFYQVMTLNVAVNSYSNALITLLLSNQFVEIKSTVFKKFEKENLFQLTCADVVERFQLWLMLLIIASRNIVETNTFDLFSGLGSLGMRKNSATGTSDSPLTTPPRTTSSILPQAFTMLPTYLFTPFSSANSFLPAVSQVLAPFLVVLGSEMLVDWLKHAYIGKFNNMRPKLYGRFLDVLAKDYYTNAFSDHDLTRRLGLPVIPLSCLFFRVSVQTYQMFLAVWIPQHPSSTAVEATSLTSIHNHYASSPVPSSAPLTLKTVIPTSVAHLDALFRAILANVIPSSTQSVHIFTVILIITGFIVLLILKILLGMLLLTLARSRYKAMKDPEINHHPPQYGSANAVASLAQQRNADPDSRGRDEAIEDSRRMGGWGVVEVNDDTRRWIYKDDPEGLRRLKEKEEKGKSGKDSGISIETVSRYEMVAKRIW